MATAAAGSMSLAQENLRTILAACATFRTLVGAADAAAALPRIHHEFLTAPAADTYTADEMAGLRPYAIVSTDPACGFERVSHALGSFSSRGRLILILARSVPVAAQGQPAIGQAEADLLWRNTVGQIMDELATLSSGTAGYLSIEGIRVAMGPGRYTDQRDPAVGEEMGAVLLITWSESE
jgi:hypothetical protein